MDNGQYKFSYKAEHLSGLALCVYNVGFEQCRSGFRWGPGVRDHYLLHQVTSGFGYYSFMGQTYRLSAGDVFLSYPGTVISYSADERNPWEYYWVGFQGRDVPILLEGAGVSKEKPVLHVAFGERLKTLLLQIYEARGSGIVDEVRMAGRLYELFSWLMEASGAERERKGYVRRACEYIANNFSRPVTVPEIAAYVGLSRSWLYREFQRELGVSPVQYLNRFRLQQACLLLENPLLSIKAVSCSVGFEDPLYFSRAFKKQFGVSPKIYGGRQGR